MNLRARACRVVRSLCLTAWAIGALGVGTAHAAPISAVLLYTTFGESFPVGSYNRVEFNYNGTNAFTLTNNTTLASGLLGADGILIDPNSGMVVIGGQAHNIMYGFSTTGTLLATVSPGANGQAFESVVTPDNKSLWVLPNISDSRISIVPLGFANGGNGTSYNVIGDDVGIRGIAFIGDTAYYGTALNPGGSFGNMGTITFNGTNFVTKQLTNVPNPAHALQYDPFTNQIWIADGFRIRQLSISGDIITTVGAYDGPAGAKYDHLLFDGLGHLWAMSNDGNITFIDYAATGDLDTKSFVDTKFLKANLDDAVFAPSSSVTILTPTAVPEPASLVLLGTGLLAAARRRWFGKR